MKFKMAMIMIMIMTMTMISLRGKAGYSQDIGKTNVGRSKRGEHLFPCAQMDESAIGILVIPLEILWNNLEQYCFGQWNIRIIQRYEDFPGL
jgi:hypothetical protein